MHDCEDRVFGKGECQIDGKPKAEYTSNIKASGISGRAKQFMPFAALRGFSEMINEVSCKHDDNINQHRNY